MYKGIESKVQIGKHVSTLFLCNVGVREVEKSSILFSLLYMTSKAICWTM